MGLFDFLKKKQAITTGKIVPQQSIESSPKPTIQTDAEGIPTLASRIENAFPSSNGLYPHEILMLDYASSYKTSGMQLAIAIYIFFSFPSFLVSRFARRWSIPTMP